MPHAPPLPQNHPPLPLHPRHDGAASSSLSGAASSLSSILRRVALLLREQSSGSEASICDEEEAEVEGVLCFSPTTSIQARDLPPVMLMTVPVRYDDRGLTCCCGAPRERGGGGRAEGGGGGGGRAKNNSTESLIRYDDAQLQNGDRGGAAS